MRPIDADAIPWTDLNDDPNSEVRVLITFADKVNRMPTIEPERKRGNWEVIEAESWKGGAYARCSECGTGFAFGAFFEPDEFKFCPECGAEMEVNDDHND